MAQVRILYWKEIPYGVRATDENGQVSRQLPEEFGATVDAAAMADGDTDQDAYRAGFAWGPAEERQGSARTAADAAVGEIVAAYPKDRLKALARRQGD